MAQKKHLKTKGSKSVSQPKADERRLVHRHTLVLDAEVHFHEQFVKGMFRCHTRNIGLGGVFLPSEKMPITRNTDIELVFRAQARAKSKQFSINAKVVRNSADGAALEFCPNNEQHVQGLRRFLLKAKIAKRR